MRGFRWAVGLFECKTLAARVDRERDPKSIFSTIPGLQTAAISLALACFALPGAAQEAVPAEYQDCETVLWSHPANTLADFVPEGYGARTEGGRLHDIVKDLRCSDDQIIRYMEHHGLPYRSKIERDNVLETGRGPYNRILDFCIRHRTVFDRWLRGECGGVTRFMMVDDQITHIISHGFK